ncbi:hypothetical protein [Chromobacterium rhizoryzae]|uniref:hypothetical protein n=1 Tax=Chromobacterium rhizoryzae TaxID=1778675 RepID=UPI001D0767AE|nr:hypothetical protein [Chromobacterium rhizoryzae]
MIKRFRPALTAPATPNAKDVKMKEQMPPPKYQIKPETSTPPLPAGLSKVLDMLSDAMRAKEAEPAADANAEAGTDKPPPAR